MATHKFESTLLAYEQCQPGIFQIKRSLTTWSKVGVRLAGYASGGLPCVEHGLVVVRGRGRLEGGVGEGKEPVVQGAVHVEGEVEGAEGIYRGAHGWEG